MDRILVVGGSVMTTRPDQRAQRGLGTLVHAGGGQD